LTFFGNILGLENFFFAFLFLSSISIQLLKIYIKKITFQDKTVVVVNIQEHLSGWG